MISESIYSSLVRLSQIDELGGMAEAVESGMPKLRIEECAARKQAPALL